MVGVEVVVIMKRKSYTYGTPQPEQEVCSRDAFVNSARYWASQKCVACANPGFQPIKGSVYCYDCYQKEWAEQYEMKATTEQLERYISRHPNLRSKVTKRVVFTGRALYDC